ncbi:putative Sulfotransferase family cytosolic 1B member 1 [Hypsibius exemplaris]|uniref:Sulfotransferase family cytosolic 1B member 1 n=1 Tax=Hypsibius exemplaris TaxID=2072580 RepID=A0A1W0WXF2_HYPEX|nr:putative Sulfotransferase family cytosolic 1B member 1 [Hypsibius exemplaris]
MAEKIQTVYSGAPNGVTTTGEKEVSAAKPGPTVQMWPVGYHHPDWTKDINGTKVPYPFWTVMDEVADFQAAKEDIAICTFPKCGTTWMNAIVEMITKNADPACLHDGKSLEWKNPYLELSDPTWPPERRPNRLLATLPPGRVFFTHLGYDALPKSIAKNNTKIVYVVRNPKDTIVSMYHFFRSHYPMQYHGDLQEIINSFTEDRVMYGPFYDHTASYVRQKGKNPNIFFTSFEELSENFVDVVTRLAAFLERDLTPEQIQVIFYECAFDQMKNNETVNKAAVGARGYFDFSKSPFIRAGKVGNWKSHFTPEQNLQIDAWTDKNLQRPELQGLKFRYE